MGAIRLCLVADDNAYARGLSEFLANETHLELGSASSAQVAIVISPQPVQTIKDLSESMEVLVIGSEDPEAMIEVMEAGATGYLTLEESREEVAAAAVSLASGEAIVPKYMLGSLLRHVIQRRRAIQLEVDKLSTLTDREREVFDLLAHGMNREAISARLFISVGTVRTHLQRIFRKLDIHTHAEVVAIAARCGLFNDQRYPGETS